VRGLEEEAFIEAGLGPFLGIRPTKGGIARSHGGRAERGELGGEEEGVEGAVRSKPLRARKGAKVGIHVILLGG
jgi:hypothetical protein